jgi:hypothetical protein
MNGKHLLAAALDRRTLPWLLVGAVPAAVAIPLGLAPALAVSPVAAVAALGAHLFAVRRLMGTREFQEEMERREMGERLQAQIHRVESLSRQMDSRLKTIFPFGEKRSLWVRKEQMLARARSVYQEWLARPAAYYERFRDAELALELAEAHLRMIRAYQAIYIQNGPFDLRRAASKFLREVQVAGPRMFEPIQMVGEILGLDLGPERPDREREAYLQKLQELENEVERLHKKFFALKTTPEGERVQELLVEVHAWEEALDEVRRRSRVRVR